MILFVRPNKKEGGRQRALAVRKKRRNRKILTTGWEKKTKGGNAFLCMCLFLIFGSASL